MSGFTKLDQTILTSSVWSEDDQTRIVWITMLALADPAGVVQASIPGLARQAAVPIEAVERAIKKFESPDPYSRTPDLEGRRAVKVDGGWFLVNYPKYREKRDEAVRREQIREAVKRFREKKKDALKAEIEANLSQPDVTKGNQGVITGNQCNQDVIKVSQGKPKKAQEEGEGEAEERIPCSPPPPSAPKPTPVAADKQPRKEGPPAEKRQRDRNPLFDTLCEISMMNVDELTPSAGGRVGKALSDIKQVAPDVTPEMLRRRAKEYRRIYPNAPLTPTALAGQWAKLGGPIKKQAEPTLFQEDEPPDQPADFSALRADAAQLPEAGDDLQGAE